jgi:hypothetical protein
VHRRLALLFYHHLYLLFLLLSYITLHLHQHHPVS